MFGEDEAGLWYEAAAQLPPLDPAGHLHLDDFGLEECRRMAQEGLDNEAHAFENDPRMPPLSDIPSCYVSSVHLGFYHIPVSLSLLVPVVWRHFLTFLMLIVSYAVTPQPLRLGPHMSCQKTEEEGCRSALRARTKVVDDVRQTACANPERHSITLAPKPCK